MVKNSWTFFISRTTVCELFMNYCEQQMAHFQFMDIQEQLKNRCKWNSSWMFKNNSTEKVHELVLEHSLLFRILNGYMWSVIMFMFFVYKSLATTQKPIWRPEPHTKNKNKGSSSYEIEKIFVYTLCPYRLLKLTRVKTQVNDPNSRWRPLFLKSWILMNSLFFRVHEHVWTATQLRDSEESSFSSGMSMNSSWTVQEQ